MPRFVVSRFVVLRHETPPGYPRASHYDLMFEHDGVLRTWACEPLPAAGSACEAERLPDHRLAYLDYEGAISGDRGSVSRVDEGTFEWLVDTPALVRLALSGQLLRGELTLVPWNGDAPANPDAQRWRVSWTSG